MHKSWNNYTVDLSMYPKPNNYAGYEEDKQMHPVSFPLRVNAGVRLNLGKLN